MRRRSRPYEALSLRERLALDCEFNLVETLEDREDDDPWIRRCQTISYRISLRNLFASSHY